MNFEEIHQYLLSKPGAKETYPFGLDVMVLKVGGKMFALINKDRENLSINLKCDPNEALILRETYEAIVPGYHMNKKHWNTIYVKILDDKEMITKLINHSYDLVFKSLKKSERESIISE